MQKGYGGLVGQTRFLTEAAGQGRETKAIVYESTRQQAALELAPNLYNTGQPLRVSVMSSQPPVPAEPATILVVDDDCDVRSALRDTLDAAGYRSVCVGNGDEALAFLRRNPRPAAILLDLFMPVMNGWEFVRRIRATRFGDVPVLVVTSSEPHWGSPVPRVLRKPISSDELVIALAEAMNPSRGSHNSDSVSPA